MAPPLRVTACRLCAALAAAGGAAGIGLDDASPLLQLQAAAGFVGGDSLRGYFYDDVVDGTDARFYAPPAVPAEEGGAGPRADGSPGSRVLIMSSNAQGISAIDDVALKLKILLMLASALHAVPVVGRPRTLLGGIWGNSTTDSWGDYVSSSPRLRHMDEIRCEEGQQATLLWSEHWLGALPPAMLANVFDRSRPLCLVINFLIFKMRPDWHAQGPTHEWGLVMSGHNAVQLWRSPRVMDLMISAWQQVPALQGEYNVAHVRRGDFRHSCTSVAHVLSRMEALDTSRPWLVMTNAEDAWLADFGRAADAAGVRFVLEGDLRGLAGLDDNFLRYQTLQCLYGYAVHRIYTLKSLEAYCRVPGQRIELQPGHLCQGQGDPSHVVISGSKD